MSKKQPLHQRSNNAQNKKRQKANSYKET